MSADWCSKGLFLNSLHAGKFVMDLYVIGSIFFQIIFSQNSFRNACSIRVPNSLDPDQAQHYVRPDLDPNCLQGFSAEDTSRLRVDSWFVSLPSS